MSVVPNAWIQTMKRCTDESLHDVRSHLITEHNPIPLAAEASLRSGAGLESMMEDSGSYQ